MMQPAKDGNSRDLAPPVKERRKSGAFLSNEGWQAPDCGSIGAEFRLCRASRSPHVALAFRLSPLTAAFPSSTGTRFLRSRV